MGTSKENLQPKPDLKINIPEEEPEKSQMGFMNVPHKPKISDLTPRGSQRNIDAMPRYMNWQNKKKYDEKVDAQPKNKKNENVKKVDKSKNANAPKKVVRGKKKKRPQPIE